MKTCCHCRTEKLEDDFYKCPSNRDKLQSWCKECFKSAYEASKTNPSAMALRAWHSLVSRTKNHKDYQHVKVLMSRNDFLTWALPEFDAWMRANPELRPSVDRIEPSGHYELGNIRVLERGQNSRRARKNHNVYAPAGQAWCGRCKAYKTVGEFSKNKINYNGLQQYCDLCRSTYRRKRGTSDTTDVGRS